MYNTLSKCFAKETGKGSLIPIESLDYSNKIKLLQIVVKKKKRHYIFRQNVSCRYIPYEFELNDVLLRPCTPLDVEQASQELFCRWRRKYFLSKNFGGEIITEETESGLSVSDLVACEADFGQIYMEKIPQVTLVKQLEKRRINLAHSSITQIRFKDKRCVLCVVQGIAKLAEDADIRRLETVSVGLPSVNGNDANAIGYSDSNTYGVIGLVKGTPIAYKVCELQVDKYGGVMVPCIGDGVTGGFRVDHKIIGGAVKETKDVDLETDGTCDVDFPAAESPEKVLKLLRHIQNLPKEERQKISNVLLTASAADIQKLDSLFNLVETRHKNPNDHENFSLQTVKSLTFKEEKICCSFLLLAGFEVKNDELYPPSIQGEMFEACSLLMEAMSEMRKDLLVLIRKCSSELRPALLSIVENFMQENPTIEFNRHVESLARDPVGSDILKTLNIQMDLETEIPLESQNRSSVDGVDELYWWLCATTGHNNIGFLIRDNKMADLLRTYTTHPA